MVPNGSQSAHDENPQVRPVPPRCGRRDAVSRRRTNSAGPTRDCAAPLASGAGWNACFQDDLIQAAWPGLAIEDSNLTVQIAALRRVFEEAAGGAALDRDPAAHGYRYVGPQVANGEPPPKQTPPSLALPDKPAVAVLPFSNLSGDPDQEYFADGLTEDIITALSLWRSFPVIARNSTFVFKGKAGAFQKSAKHSQRATFWKAASAKSRARFVLRLNSLIARPAITFGPKRSTAN